MQHFWLDFVTLFDDPAIPPHDPPRVFLVPDAELPRYQPWALALMDAQLVAAIKLLDIELPDLAARLYSYILPLVWISLKALRSQPTFLLGVNGMQGSGKTTLGLVLAKIYAHLRISYEMISLDNFYLPFKDREDLPKKYYWFRGPPGSHSVDLLQDLFRNWRSQQHDKLQIPKFDKSKKQAQGDRCGLQQIDGRAKVLHFPLTPRFTSSRDGCSPTRNSTRTSSSANSSTANSCSSTTPSSTSKLTSR